MIDTGVALFAGRKFLPHLPAKTGGSAEHDLPDGRESESNVIDFRKRLRHRVEAPAPHTDHNAPDVSDQDAYRYAEHGDGRRRDFGRYDVLWLGLIASLGWIFWYLILR